MAIVYKNRYVGTYDPGNVKQSVLSTNITEAVALLIATVVDKEPFIIQKTDTNIAVSVPDV